MFSKPMYNTEIETTSNDSIPKTKSNIIKNEINMEAGKMTYSIFFKEKVVLSKYKIPVLKEIAKFNKLHISGSKPKLISRIEIHFRKQLNAIKIQKIFRKYLVSKMFSLKGYGFKNRDKCVNNSDFYTMEPINEIPHNTFFSYTDSNNFTYGFDITSLVELIKHNHSLPLINPYNREKIDTTIKSNIINLYNILHIIYPEVIKDSMRIPNSNGMWHQSRNRNTSGSRSQIISISRRRRVLNNNFEQSLSDTERVALFNKMNEMRSKPINDRIQELFIDIDLLGNYTQPSWFTNLSRIQYLQLYQSLYNIWRGYISIELRRSISCLNDPFAESLNDVLNIEEITLERIKESCLYVIENMVYTGVDLEYRKIGTFHALTALTLVSIDAREHLQWLYDSIA